LFIVIFCCLGQIIIEKGNPPETLQQRFSQVLEQIHQQFSQELQIFNGETSTFDNAEPLLRTCLQSRYDKEKKKTPG